MKPQKNWKKIVVHTKRRHIPRDLIFRVTKKTTSDLARIKLTYHQHVSRRWRNLALLEAFHIPEDRLLPSCVLTDWYQDFGGKKVTLPFNMKISAESSSKCWHCVPYYTVSHPKTPITDLFFTKPRKYYWFWVNQHGSNFLRGR